MRNCGWWFNAIVVEREILSCSVVVPYQNLTLAINWCSSRLWHIFRIFTLVHRFPHANDTQSKNIFRCLTRARLPSIFSVSAIASSSFGLSTWPRTLTCLDVITFKRLLSLSSTASLVNLSVHKIRIMRLRDYNSVASSRVLMVLLIVQPSHYKSAEIISSISSFPIAHILQCIKSLLTLGDAVCRTRSAERKTEWLLHRAVAVNHV